MPRPATMRRALGQGLAAELQPALRHAMAVPGPFTLRMPTAPGAGRCGSEGARAAWRHTLAPMNAASLVDTRTFAEAGQHDREPRRTRHLGS